ncbi:MAG: alpha/beta hydrolase [Leptolyngbyaceae cyanobacterium]
MTGLLQLLLLTTPVLGVERIYASFGPLERYIEVADLKTYVDTGELPDRLSFLSRFLTPEQLERLRSGLSTSADIDTVTVSQFLYTTQGEAILQWLGELIQTQGRQNGALGIRGALILAAADRDGGLNALNVLKHFPTQGVRVDLQTLLGVARAATNQINQTQAVTTQIYEQARRPGDNDSTKADLLARDLTSPGPNAWQLLTLTETSLPTDLYLPEGDILPLVVVSHGLGGDRTTLAYLAKHLVSHGFAVAVVEHSGSNDEQIKALLSGEVGEAVEPEEMVHRPLDIQMLLTELEALTLRDPALRDRLDFQHVGVLGQSMGAYTTLALAGATVDLETLEQSCPPEIKQLNLSLLLQCLVPSLPQPLPELHDDRVKAAIAITPLDSAVFGPTGMGNIDVPIMVVSGSSDTVTPALPEQIRPFTWLESPERYLMLMDGGTHFSTIHNLQTGGFTLPEEVIGPNPELAQDYVKAMGVAFLKTYLAEDTTYQQYLEPAYTASLSQTELPVVLTRDVTLED